ncbi:MAG: hypothetical protein ACKO96_32645 [Flammeovirgaceae bacterium]
MPGQKIPMAMPVGMQAMPGFQNIQGIQGLPGFQGIQGMQSIPGLQGMQGWNGIPINLGSNPGIVGMPLNPNFGGLQMNLLNQQIQQQQQQQQQQNGNKKESVKDGK